MSEVNLKRLKILDLDSPEFSKVARKIEWPERDPDRQAQFWPAMEIFNIPKSDIVELSYLESTRRSPLNRFDRHLKTEEMFVCLEGEYVMPMALCREPGNPDEVPRLEDVNGFHVKAGQAYILKPNTWHNGGWVGPGCDKMRYIMVLSGHRAGEGAQGKEDHILKPLPENHAILPEGEWYQAEGEAGAD